MNVSSIREATIPLPLDLVNYVRIQSSAWVPCVSQPTVTTNFVEMT